MPPAAKQGDTIVAVDTHVVLVPSPGGPVPTPLPHPFSGVLDGGLSANVFVGGLAAATVGSTATNTPAHVPTPPGTSFQAPPGNTATVTAGSGSVYVNGQPVARAGDPAETCADPVPNPQGRVIAVGTVIVG
jgi:uncharacterized Zn-binding protein involved in type VI secretion